MRVQITVLQRWRFIKNLHIMLMPVDVRVKLRTTGN